MSGKMARGKGQRGEREVIALLQPIVDEECQRVGRGKVELSRNLLQTREGGCDIAGMEWMALEVKRVENQSMINQWWQQTLRQAGPTSGGGVHERVPVLLYRPNNVAWKCRMRVPIAGIGGPTILATITVDIQTFLVWFRYRVRAELSK